jgi:hypothetical protein
MKKFASAVDCAKSTAQFSTPNPKNQSRRIREKNPNQSVVLGWFKKNQFLSQFNADTAMTHHAFMHAYLAPCTSTKKRDR